jgi:Tfp pilus assembly protein PilP
MKFSVKFWKLPLGILLSTIAVSQAAPVLPEAILKLRDPFKRPPIKVGAEGPKSELQAFPVEKFKLLGVMTGSDHGHMKAMVQGPNGKTYFVQEKMFIGIRNGFIQKITDTAVIVREKIVNVLGQEEAVNSEILLPADAVQDVKRVTSESGW